MNDRQCWIEVLERVGRPVLENLANRTLRQNMPVKEGVNAKFTRIWKLVEGY